MVELALVLPVLLAAAFAIVLVAETGIARLALQHAVSEAARAGALTNDDAEIRRTLAGAASPLRPEEIDVDVDPKRDQEPRDGDPRGSLLTVRAAYRISLPLPYIGLDAITLRASATRRVEWTP